MSGPPSADEQAAPDAPSGAASTPPSDLGLGWLAAVLKGVQARARLLALDVRRAGLSLAQIVMFALLCGLLVFTAWLGLMAVLCLAVLAMGLHAVWAAVLVIALNLLVARLLWHRISYLATLLTLPAVRAHLLGGEPHG